MDIKLLRKRNIVFGVGSLMLFSLLICISECLRPPDYDSKDGVSIAEDWNRYILKAEINTEGYRGPVAARAYGYIGLAAYEAALPGFAGDFRSMGSHFAGLHLPPKPPADKFELAISLNACYATIIGKFFPTAPQPIKRELTRIEEKWDAELSQGMDTSVMRISKAYGREVANAVFQWSSTDSLGYRANHHNYDRNYIPPEGEGKWVTSMDFPMPALLPYWGKVRPFIIRTEDFLAHPLPPYSTENNQRYQKQALELISLSKPLSAENQWIAEFWNDDRPGLTFTPAGHWLAITNQLIQMEHPPIEKTMETYLKVGFVLCDAMIACWYSKFEYSMERPETYIQKHIDKNWRPFSPSPPFPGYPSGHSTMGAAAASVLTVLYGDSYEMTDRSHDGLEEFVVKPRRYTSFDQMAKENALSRMLMGVHWRMDCEEGLRLGSMIGNEVNQIVLENKLTE